MGPSPEQGSVWAFARSFVASPLLIDSVWEVWDGQHVVQDEELKVSDTSVIPSVLFLSLKGERVPPALLGAQGMLLQQPGLWDGRPYYQHQAFRDVFLVCSVAEGRWRLGPLPFGNNPRTSDAPALFAQSACALPQEIVEPWHALRKGNGYMLLEENTVRLSTTRSVGVPRPLGNQHQHPRHLVIEGVSAGDGFVNGVYRRAPQLLRQRPMYHKTDNFRPACLWFAGADWRLGPSADSDRVFAYASSSALSPLSIDAPWKRLDDGWQETVKLTDASQAIPDHVVVSGARYVQQPKLCDARPVYQKATEKHDDASVYFFFRAHEREWWLGPTLGGTECLARATGSLLKVVPSPDDLFWKPGPASLSESANLSKLLPPTNSSDEFTTSVIDPGLSKDVMMPLAKTLLLTVIFIASSLVVMGGCPWCSHKLSLAKSPFLKATENPFSCCQVPLKTNCRKSSSLACVVCLEAPREILLMPCRHVCCCKACADRLEHCPMCRARKADFAKVFL